MNVVGPAVQKQYGSTTGDQPTVSSRTPLGFSSALARLSAHFAYLRKASCIKLILAALCTCISPWTRCETANHDAARAIVSTHAAIRAGELPRLRCRKLTVTIPATHYVKS